MINKVEKLLKQWFTFLLKNKEMPSQLIDTDFNIEDGMNLKDYWFYESTNFKNISPKYHLDAVFSIKIVKIIPLNINKYIVFLYIFNKYNNFSFKMTMTIRDCLGVYKVSSNDFQTQVVAKYAIDNDARIIEYGIAIKISKDFSLFKFLPLTVYENSFDISPDFDGELFYSGRYALLENGEKDTILNFKVYLKNNYTGKMLVEKRQIIFDKPDFKHKPYQNNRGIITIIDDRFPVNICLINNNKAENFSYPRNHGNIIVDDYEKIIITDAQDNDWVVK